MKRFLFFGTIFIIAFVLVLEIGIRLFQISLNGQAAQAASYFEKTKIDGKPVLKTENAWLRPENGIGDGMWEEDFLEEKPLDEFRIIRLGGSFMGGFLAGSLDRTLRDLTPMGGGRFEVVNAAGAGFNSLQVLDVAKEVVRYHPDLILVATGNNEFLVDGINRFHPQQSRLGTHIRSYGLFRRVVQVLKERIQTQEEMLDFSLDGEPVVAKWRQSRIHVPDDAAKRTANFHFQENLEALAGLCNEWRVAAAYLVLPVNERYPPNFFNPTRECGDFIQCQRMLLSSYQFLACGEHAAALNGFRKAYGERSPEAALRFIEAVESEMAGDPDRAGGLYIEACDMDESPVRINSDFRGIVDRIGRENKIPVLDLHAAFKDTARSRGKAFNDFLFQDYCHPNPMGLEPAVGAVMGYLFKMGVLEQP